MGLASYFGKNALAIQHVLQQSNYAEIEQVLGKHVVELAFDEDIRTVEGTAIADIVVRLLARLYPRIKLTALVNGLETELRAMEGLAKAINGRIEICNLPATATICIGSTKVAASSEPKIYVGSNVWEVVVNMSEPVGIGSSTLPFAAGVAGCIGVANIFRYVFQTFLHKGGLDEDVRFSLLDNFNDVPAEIVCDDLGDFAIVGSGAIGNGCLWALQRLVGVSGNAALVDYQTITDSNLQRYLVAVEGDRGKSKTLVAENYMKGSSVSLKPYECVWREFAQKHRDQFAEVVLTCLDTIEERMAVQASLPKHVFNGYTDDGILGISRHVDFANEACINCMYMPIEQEPGLSERVAKEIGVKESRIRNLLYLNAKVDEQLLREIAVANGLDYKKLKQFLNIPILEFYQEFVCGGVLIKLQSAQKADKTVEAPLAFQSAIAGILLIAELYIFRSNAPYKPRYNRSHYNPMKPIRPERNFLHHPLPKNSTGRCICTDNVYRDRYHLKWTDRDVYRVQQMLGKNP